ncbi:Arginine-tRNA-protein transferase [Ancylostoma caninum]|uniref:Arginyl-tRNA--protein transferase 1 n=1 Tax=Ancylostoma caninum TaxID=29170 RepID=A0A368G7Z9_ANCCA|nr:Arginine-tRNA-protein transferase [Ancylostoma caninum]
MVKWSIIEYCGLTEKSSCGYCKNAGHKASLGTENGVEDPDEGDSVSFGHIAGVWAHGLSCDNYQKLLDKGWRRSGKYIYKPTMERTCCPQYTIRLDSTKFILSRSQRRVLRQMNEFLKNDVRPRSSVREEQPMETVAASSSTAPQQKPHDGSNNSSKKVDKTDNPVQKKKEMRRQRCFARWREKGLDVEEMKRARAAKEEARRRTVESYILEPDDSWKHRLEVKLVRTSSQEFKERYDESFLLFEKYQKIIHKDNDSSKAGFKRFLVDTPLFDDEILRPPPGPYTTGSYHQWYILDGRLLAVGVIDILPRCVSSKYMYYDPDYAFLSLGTYTALREIAFTREVMKHRPDIKYYYMGYYISTCPKMRYKGKFRPSELLCDRSFQWVPLNECDRMLNDNDNKFTVFRPNETPAEMQTRDQLVLLVDGKILPYADICDLAPSLKEVADSEEVKEKLDAFASRIGSDMSGLILYLSDFQDIDTSE